ncbi:MAG: hypothetical protein HXX81_06350, partial [Campylobacterales bacterium]|nr:hypothetical protein [Campylobacterales bacterium]
FYGSNTNGYNWLKNSEVNLTNLNSNTNYEVILSYVEVNSYNVNECYDNYYHEINSSLISFKTSFPNNYSSSYSYSSSSSSYNYIDNITSSITSAISSIYSSAIQSSSSSVKIDTIISSIEGDLQTKIQIENLNGVTISELDNKKIVSTLTELVNGTKVSSNLELSKDGTVTATVTLKNDNIETKQTTLTTEAGVTATILQDGSTKIENISMDTTTGIQTTTDIVLKVDGKSETTVKIKDSTGKMLESVVNTIAGSELTLKQDGSIEQVLSVEKIVTDVKISKNGEIEATLNNEDRIDTKINLPVGSKTEIKENGTITNHITTDKVVTQIEANKKGDSKTVIENIDGIKREITLQEGSQIIATNDGTITATKQEAIQNGTIQNEIIAKSDGEILATIIQSEELVDTKSLRDILYREYNITENVSKKTKLKTINYSLRKDYNSATIEYLSQTEPSNVRNIVKKEPRLKVSYSTRKEYSYNPRDINITETVIDTKTRKMYVKNQQRNIDYNTNITLTPVNDTQFEEVVYLAGYKELKLTNGIVDISSNYEKYGQNREFVIKNAIKFNSTKQQEIQSSKIEEDSSNKYQTEIKLSNNLDLTADILAINKNNNKREKISYSVRKDFDSAKIELIEDLTKSLFDKLDKRLKVTYSTRKSFDFSGDYEFFQEQNSTFNKKESKDVILALILPSDDAKFIERVYFNGIKTIMLIEGSSMITLNEITEQMILNKEYIVPSNKPQTTDDNIREVKNIQVQFNSGWNQKSSPIDKDITDMFIYEDYDYIYTFSNNNYQKDPEIIKSKQGYWIKSKNMQNINFTGFEYTQNYDLYPRGWSLLGNSENTTIKNIKELNPEIKSVYQYRNNSWNTTDNYILNSGDGYWIYKIDSDINQSIKNGWNLLSIPVDKNTSIEKYSSILVSLYTYRDKNYILNPSIIKPHEGFWLKSTSNATVGFYGNSYNFDVSILKDGWNLVGGKIDSIKSIKEQYSNIEKLYIFEENRYIDDTNIDFIPSGIGYWVYVK